MKSSILTIIVCLLVGASGGTAHDGDRWQPFDGADLFQKTSSLGFGYFGSQSYAQSQPFQEPSKDQCELHKVGFTQDLYFQYIQYKTDLPSLKEFSLCFWTKFSNHSNDHPIFSYAVEGQPKAILSWVSNTDRSSYFSLAVAGHTLFRLNYPLRLNRWYHTCQSWNGKTGEWQIWVNTERVGRGFYNRLVGHTIPSGGIAITGQEQSQLGGGFQEGPEAPKDAGGMLGEVTMIQFYSVALTAGKAHKDHKHHHAHQFDKAGNPITTPPTTTPNNRPTLPQHPLLTGGQINRNVVINLAAQQQPASEFIQGQEYNVQFSNGQFAGGSVSNQLTRAHQQGSQSVEFIPRQNQLSLPPLPAEGTFSSQSISLGSSLANPANVQYLDNTQLGSHSLFKRGNKDESISQFGYKISKKRDTTIGSTDKKQKRELFIGGGTILEGFQSPAFIDGPTYQQSLLNGLAGVGENQPVLRQIKHDDDREPAEAEVKAVMNICTGCDPEPFDKALVFGWRTVSKKLFSGAYYMPAVAQCRVF